MSDREPANEDFLGEKAVLVIPRSMRGLVEKLFAAYQIPYEEPYEEMVAATEGRIEGPKLDSFGRLPSFTYPDADSPTGCGDDLIPHSTVHAIREWMNTIDALRESQMRLTMPLPPLSPKE